ncbi:MAG: type II toxin-antitoxin system VapC family toxin [Planctomycetota bacterium]
MSREAVIDSSVSVAWVLPDERSDDSERLLGLIVRREVRVAAPELWHYEVLNVLRTAVLRGRIDERQAREAATVLSRLPVESVPPATQGHSEIVAAAMELCLSAYDAAYFTLARTRGNDLVTADQDLLALRSRFPWIRSLPDYLGLLAGDPDEP